LGDAWNPKAILVQRDNCQFVYTDTNAQKRAEEEKKVYVHLESGDSERERAIRDVKSAINYKKEYLRVSSITPLFGSRWE